MDAQRDANRKRMLIGIGAAAAVIALVVVAVVLTDDDGDDVELVDDTSSTVEQTTTTESTTTTTEPTTTTSFAPTADPAQALWPRAHSSQRFESPVAAAQSFAVDFLGLVDPIVGELREGDARSGEVPIYPIEGGPETTVLVRQLEDDTWFVIGSDTADITLESPAAGEMIDCPVRLTGQAMAFEGTVDVAIHADAVDEPIGTGFVTGSGGGEPGPFDDEVDCDESQLGAAPQYGAIVMTTLGGEDASTWTAEVIRVQLK